jgi:hypothetical protein
VTPLDTTPDGKTKETPKDRPLDPEAGSGNGKRRWWRRKHEKVSGPAGPSDPRPAGLYDDRWIEGIHGLDFPLSYLHLPTLRFKALALDIHPTRLPSRPGELDLPLHRYGRGFDALIVYSQPTVEKLPRVTLDRRFLRYVPGHFHHYALSLSGTFEEYVKALSSKARHELLRKTRKFSTFAAGTLECRIYTRPEEMAEFHTLALSVACMTYQAKWLHAAIPEGPEYRAQLEEEAAEGHVRGFLLFHGGQPIAYGNCLARGGVLDYLQTGYDPEYRKWSPGMVLLHEMLEKLFAEGSFQWLDFGSGDARWKRTYATRDTRCANVYYFRWNIRNVFRVCLHCGTDLLEIAFIRVLERIGLKERLKRLLHFRLRLPGRGPEPRDP